MNKGQFGVAAALLALLVGFSAFGALKPSGVGALSRPKWEYRIEGIPDLRFDEAMASLGSDGWELVFARRASGANDEMAYECIFKRLK